MKRRAGALLAKARTLWRLGPANLARVAAYRALLKAGFYRRRLPVQAPPAGPFFHWQGARTADALPASISRDAWGAQADRVLGGELPVFSHRWVHTGFPPEWHRSVLTQVAAPQPQVHWTLIPDFALPGGDVKGYWETSRFDGLLILVLGWIATRRDDLREAIETWLAGWCHENPANAGLQWKCGQETSLRLMQTLLAAELLKRHAGVAGTPALARFIEQHGQRIAPTMLYAVGQDNNHGTSEAAALFAAGAVLARGDEPNLARQGRHWRALGRRWLENRMARLVMPDGSFSQHSVNYHRVMLDTCCLAETFRLWYGEAPWSTRMAGRCREATQWLVAMTEATTGDAPNLGANDGARLFVMHRQPYRDHRPTSQWASQLFMAKRAWAAGPWDEPLDWLALAPAAPAVQQPAAPAVRLWPDGGYARLEAGSARALLRLPVFRFRPSHADALHLDVWLDGACQLCDGGSYSYNAEPKWLDYFSGTASHNTVQFDDRDQMPRLSRFLFGDWLACERLETQAAAGRVAAGYRDAWGAAHRREVTMHAGRCVVTDTLSGFRRRAVLRWRLAGNDAGTTGQEGDWRSGRLRIRVRSTAPLARLELVEGWQSLHYAEKTPLPVLEAEVHSDAVITTEISWTE